uniref:Uncharacterized protein n=1 Tax=Rhizophora mucronata TaxID=61149 RepID=A0A2P2QQD3_RHIMU
MQEMSKSEKEREERINNGDTLFMGNDKPLSFHLSYSHCY